MNKEEVIESEQRFLPATAPVFVELAADVDGFACFEKFNRGLSPNQRYSTPGQDYSSIPSFLVRSVVNGVRRAALRR